MKAILNPKDLGEQIRRERKASGRTQSWVATRVGCRRQTIADLEAGRNVTLSVLIPAAGALGKALAIIDARLDREPQEETFDDGG